MGESARKHGELEYPISHLTSRYILNQKAARAFFANADPLGKRLHDQKKNIWTCRGMPCARHCVLSVASAFSGREKYPKQTTETLPSGFSSLKLNSPDGLEALPKSGIWPYRF
jgi:hypothetical protein